MKNSKKITLASQNFLYEVSAIPKEIRLEFMNKLLRRKGAASQKNVTLLQIIYSYADENNFMGWDSNYICMRLDISMDMLYCHKSRLLSSLRKYYFKWRQTEKTLTIEPALSSSQKKIQFLHKKATKMAEIGMFREAKNAYLKLERLIRGSQMRENSYVMLSEAYEFMTNYYHRRNSIKKIENYVRKLERLYEVAKLNYRLNPENDALIQLRMYYCRLFKSFQLYYVNNTIDIDERLISKIQKLINTIGSLDYKFKFIYHLSLMTVVTKDYKRALRLAEEGYQKAIEMNKENEYHTFAAMFLYLNLFISQKKFRSPFIDINKIKEFYFEAKKKNPLAQWTIYLEASLARSYYYGLKQELLHVFSEYVNTNFLRGEYSWAIYWKFILETEIYQNELLKYFQPASKFTPAYLDSEKISPKINNRISSVCFNTLCYTTVFKHLNLLWRIYEVQLQVYYFSEKDMDFDFAESLLNKLERSAPKNLSLTKVDLLKCSIKMLKNKTKKTQLLKLYGPQLEKVIESYKSEPEDISIIDYAILSLLAERLKCKEITVIVKKFYDWIKLRHPVILEPLERELKPCEIPVKGENAA